ncbi:MAG: nucleotidyl transferase AbiEii/AbiGii toxin family protein [Clostridia bacterium]|nr:nucleotidyl transferase AbiEii/AbiGii toxin family protein [Clostridia bacterium]
MIKNETFTLDWVKRVNQEQGWNRKNDQLKNLEKAIAALKLLEELKLNGIDFVFKGGTALLLLLEKLYRFSVDIDIIIESTENYSEAFDSVCNGLFNHWDEQVRNTDGNSHTRHYRFYYKPFVDDTEEGYILLDVYEGKSLYSQTKEITLKSPILKTDGKDVTVTVPTIDCILADKLTAFAPHTIGIKLSAEPGKRPKRVEILKQMFDISNLFDRCNDLDVIKETYIKIAQEEIKMAGLDSGYQETLQDSFDFAMMIGFDGKKQTDEFAVLSKGYGEFSKFVVDLSFDKWKAVLCASKIAYLITRILNNKPIEKYSNDIDLTKIPINNKAYKVFEAYLYSSPESYYYFAKSIN